MLGGKRARHGRLVDADHSDWMAPPHATMMAVRFSSSLATLMAVNSVASYGR
jgi:hypothetical protein